MTAPNCAVVESIPDRFLDCPAERLAELLPGPCLIPIRRALSIAPQPPAMGKAGRKSPGPSASIPRRCGGCS